MCGKVTLCFRFKPSNAARLFQTFTHGALLACFRRPLVSSGSLQCSRFYTFSHAQSQVALVSAHRWASYNGRGSQSTSKPRSTTTQKILPQKKKIVEAPLRKESKEKKSPKKRTLKRKLTPHQLQTIKYNKRVGEIAKLWGEQKKSLPEEPFT